MKSQSHEEDEMEKTVKMRLYDGKEPLQAAPAEKPRSSSSSASGLAIKNPALEEERARAQEYKKKIEQLEQALREEKVKSATLADTLKRISSIATAAIQLRKDQQ